MSVSFAKDVPRAQLFLKYENLLILCDTGGQTQGLTLARQVFFSLEPLHQSLLILIIFEIESHFMLRLALHHDSPICASPT
jgi:hypothetical protein